MSTAARLTGKAGPMLEVAGVSHCYGAHKALERVNVSLSRGGFHALLGPNGAGKSTLIALVTGLLRGQGGEIRVAGHPVSRRARDVRRHLGVVFQQPTLDLDLSVRQNLLYHASLHGLGRRRARERCDRELARQHLEARADDKVRLLNGGHRRRLEIARALLHEPTLLILDEASVGLDTASRQALNEHVRSLCRERGMTVLWTTHLLDEIAPQDHVVVLCAGRVIADSQAQALCTHTGTHTLQEAFHRLTAHSGVTVMEGTS
ncbi:ATP-binding cassette domain-containing protein [Halomonas kalidii]|uniref:ATP-binding cassette domain-containing protein n=1 Tax=Halomonas kalidii TaxID=3043293 RepID=A0ABT6VMS1_9GAMM|nr:ATP-binding cassette domain-containing protein [Halomonas kalidii]MDI5934532.1 ATP-binding cassette domain-containing protein [Halomonas kalidii]